MRGAVVAVAALPTLVAQVFVLQQNLLNYSTSGEEGSVRSWMGASNERESTSLPRKRKNGVVRVALGNLYVMNVIFESIDKQELYFAMDGYRYFGSCCCVFKQDFLDVMSTKFQSEITSPALAPVYRVLSKYHEK